VATPNGLLPKSKSFISDLVGQGSPLGDVAGAISSAPAAIAGVPGAPGAFLGKTGANAVSDFIDNASSGTDYSYKPLSGQISQPWQQAEDKFNKTAYDTPGYAAGLNSGVSEQSNLMGPSSGDTPENQALGARASQIYQSNVSQILRGAQPKAQQATMGLETQDLSHKAAIFANQQAQAQINYKQAAFQRQSAIEMANLKNGLYNALFGGVAQLAGTGAAMMTSGGGGTVAPPASPTPTPAPAPYAQADYGYNMETA